MKKKIKSPDEVRKEREREYGEMEKGSSRRTWSMDHLPYYLEAENEERE